MNRDFENFRDAQSVRANLSEARSRIDSVAREWTHDVEITAVTKAFPPSIVLDAVGAGCRVIGENYAQELLTKREVIDGFDPTDRPRVDFIGHLQSNKVRRLVGLVDRWCTVDRASLVKEIATRDEGACVLVQVNATDEDQKGGCAPDEVTSLVEKCRDAGLVVEGLFTVGPTEGGPQAAAPAFRLVRELVDDLGLEVASMGMSADVEVAVGLGATNVRLGSALFGARPTAAPSAAQVHP